MRISCPIHVRMRFESLHGLIQFAATVSATQTATASAHIESLLCVPTADIYYRIPHAASAWRIRTYGILSLENSYTQSSCCWVETIVLIVITHFVDEWKVMSNTQRWLPHYRRDVGEGGPAVVHVPDAVGRAGERRASGAGQCVARLHRHDDIARRAARPQICRLVQHN